METPSNPLLTITDLREVSKLARSRNILTMIDNTFASPINQNPADFGIDMMLHSATKYMGGHSDICAGAVAASKAHIKILWESSICFGGSLSDQTVWLLERSLKTMGLRVRTQTQNAQQMAEFLYGNEDINAVYYPGLPSHPGHNLAKSQMHGFGGMLSFELREDMDASQFMKALRLIKPSMSLAGVESTVTSPALTSHSLMKKEDREAQGIRDGLIRFSVGIEDVDDLMEDLQNAINKVKPKTVLV